MSIKEIISRCVGGVTLLHGDFGERHQSHACKIVQNRRWRAAKLVKRGIADNAEHPGAIGRASARDPTSGAARGSPLPAQGHGLHPELPSMVRAKAQSRGNSAIKPTRLPITGNRASIVSAPKIGPPQQLCNC